MQREHGEDEWGEPQRRDVSKGGMGTGWDAPFLGTGLEGNSVCAPSVHRGAGGGVVCGYRAEAAGIESLRLLRKPEADGSLVCPQF